LPKAENFYDLFAGGCADRFIRVASKEKRQLLNGKGSGRLIEEGLFIPKGQEKQWYELQKEKKDMQLELIA
jgi:hypothetical protein